ncbi:MAG TPA: chemotaxis protein CheX [Anaeromyxobacter sp.]|nr:chemotaxis protein CheX [Anaeromyxobacter sp.]
MSAAAGMSGWVEELAGAFEEVARAALGVEAFALGGRTESPPGGYQGAYMGLVAPTGAIQIGVAADEGGCQDLAKRLLGMDPTEPDLPAAEMADAVCEIVNIVAGGFKTRVRDRAPALQMGLPTFFRGPAQPTEHTAVVVAEVRLGSMPAAVLLVHPREPGSS